MRCGSRPRRAGNVARVTRQRERCAEAPGERLVGDEEEVPRGDRRREHEPEEETSEDHARLAITRRCGKHATPACIASEDAGKNSASCPGSSATRASSPGTPGRC